MLEAKFLRDELDSPLLRKLALGSLHHSFSFLKADF